MGGGLAVKALDSSRGTILIVEDDLDLRDLIMGALRNAGYESIGAGSAVEALVSVSACPNVALVFTEAEMPGDMDGVGLAQFISKAAPNLPLIVTSGLFPPKPRDLPPGIRYLAKPYSPSEFIALVDETLKYADRRSMR